MKQIKNAIKNLISVLENDSPSEGDSIEALEAALDRLLFYVHDLVYESDEKSYPDPPEFDYQETRKWVEARFPSFGFYNIPKDISENVIETEILVGDSIDDIIDIVNDLKEVFWRFDNTSEGDALFHFQLGYRSHWGRHARGLQLYIHDKYW